MISQCQSKLFPVRIASWFPFFKLLFINSLCETIIITIILWYFTSSNERYCGNGNYQMCVPHHVYGFHQVTAYADKKYIVDKEINKNSLTLDAKYIDRSLLVLWLPTLSIHLMPWYTRWALTFHQFESPQMEINAWIDV